MLRELLGDEQTIDLKLWALALGVRRSSLDSLPRARWAADLVIAVDRCRVREALRVTLERWDAGHYAYRYALLPRAPDAEAHTVACNRPRLWAYYPRQSAYHRDLGARVYV